MTIRRLIHFRKISLTGIGKIIDTLLLNIIQSLLQEWSNPGPLPVRAGGLPKTN
jgi:hypothetical protein